MDLLARYTEKDEDEDAEEDEEGTSPKENTENQQVRPPSPSPSSSSPDASPVRLMVPKKSAAPDVDDTLILLAPSLSKSMASGPVDPSRRSINFNPAYDQLWLALLILSLKME